MIRYPSTQADRIVRDGERITLGDVTLTCHFTPGHTKGCTTWSMEVVEAGKTRHVVFFGSTTVPQEVQLLNNSRYPAIAEDLTRTYQKLKAMPCDVFLAPHGSFFGMSEKAERLERGEQLNPFVDSTAFRRFIDEAEASFLKRLEVERKAGRN